MQTLVLIFHQVPTWCLSSHLKVPPFFSLHLPLSLLGVSQATSRCRLSLVCIFHLSLLGVSQATSSPAFLERYQVCIFHLSLLGVSQATSRGGRCAKERRLSLVCIFHLSLLGVSQATSRDAAFLSSASSKMQTPYLVSLKPPSRPFFRGAHLVQTKERFFRWLERHQVWKMQTLGLLESVLERHQVGRGGRCRLKKGCIFHLLRDTYLVSLKPPQESRLSLVCIFHLSLLGVSQATSSSRGGRCRLVCRY